MLERRSVQKGAVLGILGFSKENTRAASEALSPTSLGLMLRYNDDYENQNHDPRIGHHQFVNEDVPFSFEILPGNILEVTWEEAFDGDFDGNGEVSSQDLAIPMDPFGYYRKINLAS